jgi:hypothetical protein
LGRQTPTFKKTDKFGPPYNDFCENPGKFQTLIHHNFETGGRTDLALAFSDSADFSLSTPVQTLHEKKYCDQKTTIWDFLGKSY